MLCDEVLQYGANQPVQKKNNNSITINNRYFNYLYIYYNMPELTLFDPRAATLNWIKMKERRNKTRTKEGYNQSYFKN